MAHTEYLYSMPPAPSVGCLVQDRYLVVVDSIFRPPAGRGRIAITDLINGDSEQYEMQVNFAVDAIAIGEYAYILCGSANKSPNDGVTILRVKPSTEEYDVFIVLNAGGAGPYTQIAHDTFRNALCFISTTGNGVSTARLRRWDIASGVVTVSGSLLPINAQYSACQYIPSLDQFLVLLSTSWVLLEADDLASSTSLGWGGVGGFSRRILDRCRPLKLHGSKIVFHQGSTNSNNGGGVYIVDVPSMTISGPVGTTGTITDANVVQSGAFDNSGIFWCANDNNVFRLDPANNSFLSEPLTVRGQRGLAVRHPVEGVLVPAQSR